MGFEISNDIRSFLSEEQMHAGFTLNSSIELEDRGGTGGDPFRFQIFVKEGSTIIYQYTVNDTN